MKTTSCLMIMGILLTSNLTYASDTDLTQMSIEELMGMEVTSVSKKEQKLSDTSAAIHVVTAEDIRRSGATSIPEALKMVPALDVVQVDANRWAISTRGFNARFANKLLVMVDGRSVYTPIFSGVFWENLDYLLKDIERIEVIRGPGATLWGANAVNGVINIITRDAADTQGGYAELGAGSETRGLASIRYGTQFGESAHARSYLKLRKQDNSVDMNGDAIEDYGESSQAGFRLDKQVSSNQWITIQADAYRNHHDETTLAQNFDFPFDEEIVETEVDAEGVNLVGQWNKILSLDSDISLQGSVDYNEVDIYKFRTLDLEFKHRFKPITDHEVVWGLGYRHWRSTIDSNIYMYAEDETQSTHNINGFIQDEITFPEKDIAIQLGTKIEDNAYTGTEIQPSLRASWSPTDNSTLWSALSYASRTPSRGENDFRVNVSTIPPGAVPFPGGGTNPMPLLTRIVGQDDFDSEKLTAYEVGFRWLASSTLSWDLAAFYNKYEDLRSYEIGDNLFENPFLAQELLLANTQKGTGTGFDIAGNWQPLPHLRFKASYSYQTLDIEETSATAAQSALIALVEDRTPEHLFKFWTQWEINPSIDIDAMLTYSSERPWELTVSNINNTNLNTRVDDVWNADIQIAWRPEKHVELALIGKNLLEDNHNEFNPELFPYPSYIERAIFGKLSISW